MKFDEEKSKQLSLDEVMSEVRQLINSSYYGNNRINKVISEIGKLKIDDIYNILRYLVNEFLKMAKSPNSDNDYKKTGDMLTSDINAMRRCLKIILSVLDWNHGLKLHYKTEILPIFNALIYGEDSDMSFKEDRITLPEKYFGDDDDICKTFYFLAGSTLIAYNNPEGLVYIYRAYNNRFYRAYAQSKLAGIYINFLSDVERETSEWNALNEILDSAIGTLENSPSANDKITAKVLRIKQLFIVDYEEFIQSEEGVKELWARVIKNKNFSHLICYMVGNALLSIMVNKVIQMILNESDSKAAAQEIEKLKEQIRTMGEERIEINGELKSLIKWIGYKSTDNEFSSILHLGDERQYKDQLMQSYYMDENVTRAHELLSTNIIDNNNPELEFFTKMSDEEKETFIRSIEYQIEHGETREIQSQFTFPSYIVNINNQELEVVVTHDKKLIITIYPFRPEKLDLIKTAIKTCPFNSGGDQSKL